MLKRPIIAFNILFLCLMLIPACTPESALPPLSGQTDDGQNAGALRNIDPGENGSAYPGASGASGESDIFVAGSDQALTEEESQTVTNQSEGGQGNVNDPGAADIEPAYPGETTAFSASEPGQVLIEEEPQTMTNQAGTEQGNVSDPGAGENGGESSSAEPALKSPAGDWLTYSNESYAFAIGYPPDYQIRLLSAETIASSDPPQAFGVDFLSPESAASEVAEFEIPEMSIRIYPAGAFDPAASGGNSSVYTNPFQEGRQICSLTDIAPNCSIYFENNSWLWQLTPFGTAGEAMAQTFRISR